MVSPKKRQITIISSKGQVILPKAIRDQRHWSAGTRLTVECTSDGVLLGPAAIFPPTSIERVFGSLPYKGGAKSVEEMDAAIAAEAKRRARNQRERRCSRPAGDDRTKWRPVWPFA